VRGIAPLVAPERVYPDFVGIGAQKAGTTWLGHNLQLHPEIWMPGIKELHYFNERINDPKDSIAALWQGMGQRHREPALAPPGQELPSPLPEAFLKRRGPLGSQALRRRTR